MFKIPPSNKKMPIVNMLAKYKKVKTAAFHMPGHKGAAQHRAFYGDAAWQDITELSFSDNLHGAVSVIKQAEALYAQSQHCLAVKLCTCGSTVALLSLLHSVRDKGSHIIVQRSSHKSVFNALKICGIEPHFIPSQLDSQTGLPVPVSLKDIQQALDSCPQALGVLLTVPDYYGGVCDLKKIAALLKERNMLLLADAAHGAHLSYLFPAFYAHVDAYVCSAHKTLPALTQCSFACFNNLLLYRGFCRSLAMFHTSSPSYVLLASLDYARAYMDGKGRQRLIRARTLAREYAQLFRQLGYGVHLSADGVKMTVFPGSVCGAAYNISDFLESRGIYAEFANDRHMLLIITDADNRHRFKQLYSGLKAFKCSANIISCDRRAHLLMTPHRAMPFLKAAQAPRKYLPIKDAAGYIAACEVGVYPPALPAVTCGESITHEVCDFLLANAGHLFGADDGYICVVDE